MGQVLYLVFYLLCLFKNNTHKYYEVGTIITLILWGEVLALPSH